MPVGRPKKYKTREERLKVAADKAREKYLEFKGGDVREYCIDPNAEKYRGTKAYRLYHGAKVRSKKNNLPFDLDAEFVFNILNQSTVCPLLEVEFDDKKYLQSLDRKIPELGYTKENVWVISRRANTIKNDASLEELELIVRNMKDSGFSSGE